MTEYLDILQADGTPTGERKSRSDIHADGDWHATVHIYLFRKRDGCLELLIHLRSVYKDRYPSCWDTRFGGHVKSGETIDRTVTDELWEEIGLKRSSDAMMFGGTHQHIEPTNREIVYSYYCRAQDEDELTFQDGEVQAVRWLTPEAVMAEMQADPGQWAASIEGFRKVVDDITRLL